MKTPNVQQLSTRNLNECIKLAFLNLQGQLKPEAHAELLEKYAEFVAEKSRRNYNSYTS